MKTKLNRESRERQNAIRKALAAGIPLAGLLSATLFTVGCGERTAPVMGRIEVIPTNSECAPVVRGDVVPRQKPEIPRVPPTAGFPTPPPPKRPDLPKEIENYTVQAGDTLSKIARSRKTSLEVLMRLNEFSREQADQLKAGQQIRVPLLPNRKNETDPSGVVMGKQLVSPKE